MGKKKLDVMAKEREVFIHGQTDENGNVIVPGCVRNGIDEVSANKIFDEMAEFAKYAFNKSHAAAYAVLSYQTAYLKAYYKEEFMAATLNSFLGNLDKVPYYIDECKRLNIEILKPDINRSFTKFTVDVDKNEEEAIRKIRFGLGSVKNVGLAAVDAIVNERNKNGDYKSFTDFCERIEGEAVNKKCIESLIKAGAFDEFGETRNTLLSSFEIILDTISDKKNKSISGQVSMFDLGNSNNNEEDNELEKMKYTYIRHEEFSKKELLFMEKEMLGLYISGHPLEGIRQQILSTTNINTLNLKESLEDDGLEGKPKYNDGQMVKIAGIINTIKKKITKTNKLMVFITIEDLYGSMEVIAFENTYQSSMDSLKEDNIVMIEGRLSIKEEDNTATIIASKIYDFQTKNEDSNKTLNVNNNNNINSIIKVNISNLDEDNKEKLRNIIRNNRKENSNTIIIIINEGKELPAGKIQLNDNIINEIKFIVGNDNVIV